ncbi:MAG: hypothetical protein JOZ54_02635, partial [Acidobacteria bacterium]|nr:hypothetical protein [Acidobacteriota bacterium]
MRRIALLLLLAFVACRESKQQALTVEEARNAAAAFVMDVERGHVEDAAAFIDWDAILEKATANAGLRNELFRRSFVFGAKKKASEGDLPRQLHEILERGGSLKLLSARAAKDGTKRVLLRLLLPDGAINYHELVITRGARGDVRARDIYIYTDAENLSDSMRRTFLLAVAKDPGILQRLGGEKNGFAEHAEEYGQMMKKVREGDGEGAEAIYKRLPRDIREQKNVLMAHVFATSKLGDDRKYLAAMDEMRAKFPNDGVVDLMSIDAFVLRKMWGEAMAAIARLDEQVGDPYLDVFRANISLAKGDLAAAKTYALRAAQREPELPHAWWAQVNVALAEGNDAETLRLLKHLRDDRHVKIADLRDVPA